MAMEILPSVPLSSQSRTHGPLDREVRVLDLLPGDVDGELRCITRIVSLDDDPQYETISYTWGTLPKQKSIQVSGNFTSVTPNLYSALQRFRYPNKVRTLWIDQLCINQWDMEEKATQVSLMRDIYKQCSHCLLWLGEISDAAHGYRSADAEAALAFIKTVADMELDSSRQPLTYPFLHRFEGVQSLPAIFEDSPTGEAVRKAFGALFMYGNPWWSCVWTIQEAILPKSADIVWGPLTISRDDIMLAIRRLKSGPQGFTHCFSRAFQHFRSKHKELLRCMLYPVYGFIHTLNGQTPLDPLMRWRHREATDSRDKVYALLGLLPPHVLPSVQSCSYSISVSDVFSGATLELLRHELCLRPLVGLSEILHQTPDLPSWAIDFACSNRVGRRQLKWWGHSHRYKEFTANGKHGLTLTVSNSGKVLSLVGVQLDRVSRVNEVYTVADDRPLLKSNMWQILIGARKLLEQFTGTRKDLIEYPAGGTWSSAFWRTMIGDLIMDEYPVERAKVTHERDFIRAQESMAKGKSLDLPNAIFESLCGMVPNHAFFITENGYIGIGPPWTVIGDQAWVFYGGKVPFVMRPMKNSRSNNYEHSLQLVGDAYIHGIMDGQAVPEGHQAHCVWIH